MRNPGLIYEAPRNRKENDDTNRVFLQGIMTGLFRFGTGVKIYLSVPGSRGVEPRRNPIPIDFYGEDALRTITGQVGRGKKPWVTVEAYVRTRRRLERGINRYYMDLVGDRLEYAPEAGAFRNEVLLQGEVVAMNCFERPAGNPVCTVVNMKTDSRCVPSYPKVVFFSCRNKLKRTKICERQVILGEVMAQRIAQPDGRSANVISVVGLDIQPCTKPEIPICG